MTLNFLKNLSQIDEVLPHVDVRKWNEIMEKDHEEYIKGEKIEGSREEEMKEKGNKEEVVSNIKGNERKIKNEIK